MFAVLDLAGQQSPHHRSQCIEYHLLAAKADQRTAMNMPPNDVEASSSDGIEQFGEHSIPWR